MLIYICLVLKQAIFYTKKPAYMKKFFQRTFILFFGLLFCAVSWAQNHTITGKITDEKGDGVGEASVIVKGTKIGTSSGRDGTFSISVPASAKTLIISAINFTEREISIATLPSDIVLRSSSKNLEEVVVIGYGSQKVTKVSGAISTVKGADIEKLKPVRLEDALQGRASGVTVIGNGSPGSKPTVLIRGIPSFSGTDPIVIIDGIPQTLDDLNAINSEDIESINVLKDAATTAIYGVKGGNGVIVVTTKSGKKNQKTVITVNSNYGIQEVSKTIGVLNASEYGAIINEGSVAAGGNIIFPDLTALGVGTDWQKEIFHQAPLQTYNVSAIGGSDKMGFFLSGGYLGQDGIVGGGNKSNFNRINATANLNFQLAPKLKFIVNTSFVNLKSKGVQENSFNSIIGSALNFDPTVPVLNTVPNTVGKYGYSNLLLSEIFNPLTKLDNTYGLSSGNKLYGKLELQYNIIKNVTLTTRFGYVTWDQTGKSFTPLVFYGPLNVENTMNADGSTVTGKHNSVGENKNTNASFTSETFANYNFKIHQDHNFETVAGISFAKSRGDGINASRQDVPFNSWTFADLTSATGTNSAANTSAYTAGNFQYFRKNASYFGRVNYDYQAKYLASVTARRDGSFAFGPQNKFADFYSGSLGWIVSKEDFFKSEFIDYLKVRGSFGTVGNENVNPQYVSISTGGPSYGGTANSNGYTFGNTFVNGSTVGSYKNDALAWEKQKQFNIGFDVTFLKNKFSLTADYFEKRVNGLLFTPSVSLYLGTATIPTANIGSTKSSGVDMMLSYNDKISRNFLINTSLTFTTSTNLVTATNSDGTAIITGGSYFNGQSQTATRFQKGFTPGYFYGYKTNGLFQTQADVDNYTAISSKTGKPVVLQPSAKPGDIRYVNTNGDTLLNAADQTKIGDPFPKFTMGWNLGFEFKGFDFTMFTYASIGNDVYRAYERNANYSNKYEGVLDRWTGAGSTNDAKNPRYTFADVNSNIRVSDRYIEDGSFVKIKNIVLGYTIPGSVYKNKVFSRIHIYGQVKNAYTFTKYSGFDPEVPGGILDTGVDRGEYPQARTYSVGIDFKF
jgi:TonB-dependent starch-binding outer membrane protein SusC